MILVTQNNIIIFIWGKINAKSVKWSKVVAQQPKILKNPNVVQIKSVTIDYWKTLRELSRTVTQDEKGFQVASDKNSNTTIYFI